MKRKKSSSQTRIGERELVDGRATHQSRIESVPSSASEFRFWKNSLTLMVGRLDASGDDVLPTWILRAFEVDSRKECEKPSDL